MRKSTVISILKRRLCSISSYSPKSSKSVVVSAVQVGWWILIWHFSLWWFVVVIEWVIVALHVIWDWGRSSCIVCRSRLVILLVGNFSFLEQSLHSLNLDKILYYKFGDILPVPLFLPIARCHFSIGVFFNFSEVKLQPRDLSLQIWQLTIK